MFKTLLRFLPVTALVFALVGPALAALADGEWCENEPTISNANGHTVVVTVRAQLSDPARASGIGAYKGPLGSSFSEAPPSVPSFPNRDVFVQWERDSVVGIIVVVDPVVKDSHNPVQVLVSVDGGSVQEFDGMVNDVVRFSVPTPK